MQRRPRVPIRTLRDAFALAMAINDEFVPDGGDACAIWLGRRDHRVLDMVVLTEHLGREIDRLVDYGCAHPAAARRGAGRAVLLRSIDEDADVARLVAEYFDHRDRLATHGVALVDEVVWSGENLRSLAVATFTDESGWDDMSARILADRRRSS